MDREAWVDGAFVGADAATVRSPDPVATYGIGWFETMGAWRGRLPLWARHLARLSSSARAFGLEFESADGLAASARELLSRNDRGGGILRLTLEVEADGSSRCVMTTRPRIERSSPLRMAVSNHRREVGDRAAEHKTTARAFFERALREVAVDLAGAFDDVLILGAEGDLLETTVGNLVLLHGETLCTPALDGRLLPGLGRQAILDGLCGTGLPVVARRVDLADAENADGIWITNAVYGPRRAVLVGSKSVSAAAVSVASAADDALVAAWRQVIDCTP